MKAIWQVATLSILLGGASMLAAPLPKDFHWDPLKVGRSALAADLGMIDSERDEYATHLATQAVNRIVTGGASPKSLIEARRMLGLAFQLSPRNKRAVVVNFQLSQGVMPEIRDTGYSPEAMARLLLARGQLLDRQGGEQNQRVCRMLIHLAAMLDPKNEDAVYASEVQRLDHGAPDWSWAAPDGPDREGEKSK